MSFDRGLAKEDMVHIYNEILLTHKRDEKLPFMTIGMDLESITLSEISEIEKDKKHTISLTCAI